jgi:flagellar assembly factor FliW
MTAINRSSLALDPKAPRDDAGRRADVVRFANGLPGFEACRGFVLLATEHAGFQYLTSAEGPPASFLVVDPRRVQSGYRCQLSEADRHALKVADDEDLLWLSLVSVERDGTVAVNLRAPVVINPAEMIGQQVIPYESLYPLRHVLLKG